MARVDHDAILYVHFIRWLDVRKAVSHRMFLILLPVQRGQDSNHFSNEATDWIPDQHVTIGLSITSPHQDMSAAAGILILQSNVIDLHNYSSFFIYTNLSSSWDIH